METLQPKIITGRVGFLMMGLIVMLVVITNIGLALLFHTLANEVWRAVVAVITMQIVLAAMSWNLDIRKSSVWIWKYCMSQFALSGLILTSLATVLVNINFLFAVFFFGLVGAYAVVGNITDKKTDKVSNFLFVVMCLITIIITLSLSKIILTPPVQGFRYSF